MASWIIDMIDAVIDGIKDGIEISDKLHEASKLYEYAANKHINVEEQNAGDTRPISTDSAPSGDKLLEMEINSKGVYVPVVKKLPPK